MKKINLFIANLFYISTVQITFASLEWEDLKNAILPNPSSVTVNWNGLSWQGFMDYIFSFARDSIFALMAVVAIGMFLFIWGRLVVARWNPEEFKKAMMSFVYAAIGIFVVAFAWAIVKLVAWIDI